MLNLSAPLLQHIRDGGPYCHLIELQLNPSTVYLADSMFDVIYNGETYLGNGVLQDFAAVTIRSEITVNKSGIAFTAVDHAMASTLLANPQINRIGKIHRAYLNDDGTVLGAIQLNRFQVVGDPDINTDKNNPRVTMPIAGIFADFEKVNQRRSTSASQQKHFPTCTGHDYAAEAGKEYKWGRK